MSKTKTISTPGKSVFVYLSSGEAENRWHQITAALGPMGGRYLICPSGEAPNSYGIAWDKRSATLWAAAPDLLEALKHALPGLIGESERIARAAIAKSERVT